MRRGAADPESFVGGFFQYAGFLVCQLICTVVWLLTRNTGCETALFNEFKWFPNGLKWPLIKLVVPVALFDAGDKWFTFFGIKNAGSGLYIVVFASLTIWTALIRRFVFGQKLETIRWVAVLVITAGLAVDAVSVAMDEPTLKGGIDMTLVFGMLAAIVAAVFDAFMYTFAEHAMSVKDVDGLGQKINPSESDLCWLMGMIDLPIVLVYIVAYVVLGGHWDSLVVDEIKDAGKCDTSSLDGSASGSFDSDETYKTEGECHHIGGTWEPAGGTMLSAGLLWMVQGAALWLHYITFFYCVSRGSSVSGAVNKALQSASIFFLSWAVYCPPAVIGHLASEKNCLDTPRIVCALIVFLGVLLYGIGPKLFPDSEKSALKAGLIQA